MHPCGVQRYFYPLIIQPQSNFNPCTLAECNKISNWFTFPLINFNPCTSRGVQHPVKSAFQFAIIISIHAPSRGATKDGIQAGFDQGDFNPCTLARCNYISTVRSNTVSDFNPCASRGVQPYINTISINCIKISIHAPLSGATPITVAINDTKLISIHAPSRGATVKVNRINTSDLQNIKQFL